MSKGKILLIILVLLFSLLLRLHNYAIYPQRGATSDEYTYSFLGVSLLTKGKPISWSNFPAYKEVTNLTIRGIYFPIVSPYFDHPPLNGLLVGGFALLFGQNSFEKITLEVIRIVPIILATISSILVFLIAKKLYGYKIALWSLIIFSTVPAFVMNMRVVFAEDLLTVFFLLAILLFISVRQVTQKTAVFLGVLAGLSLLTKIAGLSVFFFLLLLFLHQNAKKKYVAIFSLVFLFFVGILLLYAFYFDWNLFWEIQSTQSTRNIGPNTLLILTTMTTIVNKIVPDGWYFFGFLSFFTSFWDFGKNKFLLIPGVVYFLFLLLSMTQEGNSGWYMIPLFPIFSILIAKFVFDSLSKPSFAFMLFLIFIGWNHVHYLLEVPFGLTPIRFRLVTLLIFLPFLVLYIRHQEKAYAVLGEVYFYLFIATNFFLSYNYIHPA